MAKAAIGNKATTAHSIVGTWSYQAPECQFESDQLLAKAGGEGFGMNASKYLCENLCLFNNVCVKNGFVVNKISIYLEESKYLLKNTI